MDKKILIVHGWMHSADMYKKLKEDLEKKGLYKVKLYELPGFGNTPVEKNHKLLDYYTKKMEKELVEGCYDYVIGHSMGGNILLKALAGKSLATKLVLLSPEYGGIALLKPLVIFAPIMPLILYLLKTGPCLITTFFIKCMALFTINRWEKIDDQVVIDTKRAAPIVAACAMNELAWDNWRVKRGEWKCGNVDVIIGEKDRIITQRKMKCLYNDIEKCHVYVIKGIGHTAVLEAYNKLLIRLLKIMS